MTIADFKIFLYTIPLKQNLMIRGQELKCRQGLVLQLTDEQGTSSLGEIAPLPGLSLETLEEARTEVLSLKTKICNQTLPDGLEQLNGGFSSWIEEMKLFPSVRFGIETAVLNLKASAKNIPLAALLHGNYDQHVPVNGLLIGAKETIVDQARDMVEQGYRAIKLKVGASDLEEDIEKVKAVSEAIQRKALLRLDANQSWDFDQALRFGKAIGPAAVEYIEEPFDFAQGKPFADTSKISEFYHETTIPVALDESIPSLDFEMIQSIEGVEVLIIKPTLWGGLERTWQLVKNAKKSGIRVIISSSFETGLGLTALASLACGISHNVPIGLDTLKWFEKDLLIDKPEIKNGYFEIPKVSLAPDQINHDLLQ